MRTSAGHLKHVDGLRALAALYVLLHHAYLTIWPIEYGVFSDGSAALLFNWALFGHMGVSVFIVISGYVLALPYRDVEREFKARDFYWRRVKRILPAYYASIGFCLILIFTYIGVKTGTHWDITIPVTRLGIAEHVLLLQHVFGSAQINHVLWSIGVEAQIYLVFPLLFLLWRRFGSGPTLGVGLAIGYSIYWLLHKTPYAGSTPQYLGLFCMGMFAAKPPAWKDLPWGLIALLSGVALIYLCQTYPFFWINREYPAIDALVGFGAMCLLIRTEETGPARRFLEWKPIVGIGAFSYSLYLIHAPLLQVVWQLVPAAQHRTGAAFAILVGVAILPILCVSYLFYRLFERPFMSKRQRGVIEGHAAP